MNLTRPLFVYDFETTGVEPATDRICQIAYAKLTPGGVFTAKSRLINPTIPIPASATAVHGITDEMVKNEPTFRQVARSLHGLMQGSDLGGYNIAGYDNELLWEEMNRAGVEWDPSEHKVVDALAIWRHMMPRKLIDAAREFCPELRVTEEDLHDAAVDVSTTVEVITAQFARWPAELATVDGAAAMARRTVTIDGVELERVDHAGVLALRADGVVVFTHRKVKGLPVIDQQKYAQWVLNSDFGENTKMHIRRALEQKVS